MVAKIKSGEYGVRMTSILRETYSGSKYRMHFTSILSIELTLPYRDKVAIKSNLVESMSATLLYVSSPTNGETWESLMLWALMVTP